MMKVFTWLPAALAIAFLFSRFFVDPGPNGREARSRVLWFFVGAFLASMVLRLIFTLVAARRAQRAARDMGLGPPLSQERPRDPASALDRPSAGGDPRRD